MEPEWHRPTRGAHLGNVTQPKQLSRSVDTPAAPKSQRKRPQFAAFLRPFELTLYERAGADFNKGDGYAPNPSGKSVDERRCRGRAGFRTVSRLRPDGPD